VEEEADDEDEDNKCMARLCMDAACPMLAPVGRGKDDKEEMCAKEQRVKMAREA
jgi:hypothetical protein